MVSDGYANADPVFDATWQARNVSVKKGLLRLSVSPDANPKKSRTYGAAEIRSADSYGYGIYSVRMRASPKPGIISSFFLYSSIDGAHETDVELGYFGDHSHCLLQCNYFTDGIGKHEEIIELGFNPSSRLHTYTIVWLPGSITWLVDGLHVVYASDNTPTTPGQILLNCWPTTGNDDWVGSYSGSSTSAIYDWVQYTEVAEKPSDEN